MRWNSSLFLQVTHLPASTVALRACIRFTWYIISLIYSAVVIRLCAPEHVCFHRYLTAVGCRDKNATYRARHPLVLLGVLMNQGINSHVIPHFLLYCRLLLRRDNWVGWSAKALRRLSALQTTYSGSPRSGRLPRRPSLGGTFETSLGRCRTLRSVGCVSQASGTALEIALVLGQGPG